MLKQERDWYLMSVEQRQKRMNFLVAIAYYGVIFCIIYFLLNHALKQLWPFVVAYFMAMFFKPAVEKLCKRTKMPRSVAVLLLILFFYGAAGTLLTLSGIRLLAQVENGVRMLPALYRDVIAPNIEAIFEKLEALIARLDPDQVFQLDPVAEQITQTIGTAVTNISTWTISTLTKGATGIPGLLVKVLVMIIMTYYMAMDYQMITNFILKQLPERSAKLLLQAKDGLGRTIGKFIASYAMIMLITFGELSIGLILLGVDRAILLAAVIAVFDILPVVGCGTVLVPWAVILLIQGNYTMGILLLVLLTVIVVVRNFVEPRIVGDQVGLHPVAALLSMFVGLYLFGPLGIWGVPILLSLLVRMHQTGTIRLFKT